MDRLPVGTVTFLFTDIEGSTWRWESHAEAMGRASARHDAIIRGAVEAAGGVVFNAIGDAFFAAFADPLDAVSAAVAAQRALTAEDWSAYGAADFTLRARMGIHTGAAELREGLYYGPPLNRTARLTAAGHGGQVLLTLAAQQLVRDRLAADCVLRDLGVHRLRNLHYTEHLFQVVAPGLPVISAPPVTAGQVAADEPPQPDPRLLAQLCPYRGLRAFREEDEPFFFGREAFSARLVSAVRADPIAAVIGPSGCGKSSVVFAGLLPQLRRRPGNGEQPTGGGHWLVLNLRPGRRPFHALAGALAPQLEGPIDETDLVIKTGQLAGALRRGEVAIGDVLARIGDRRADLATPLLIADQFEELYTLCPDVDEQHAFQDTLFEAALNGRGAPSLKLALTLRADFMGHALAYRSFADVVQGRNIVLGPMNGEELARAIARPAELQGRAFEAGLVERILDDVSRRPGALPLLEFALAELWQRQEGGWLTHAGYESIGRVGGAIAQHADAVYERLGEAQRTAARRVFVQLVKPGEGTEDTRRLATRDDIGEHWELVHVLADARLVVANRDEDNRETVELVHEALIQSWQRLRQWLNADRRFRQWQERLRFSLGQWERSEQDPDALLRGATLARAEEWVAARGAELAVAEREFVAASVAERDRQEAEREARRRREIDAANRAVEAERRRARTRAVAAWGLGLLSVGLICAVIVAGFFWRDATHATELAVVQRLAATARNVSLEGQPRRGLLLALEAGRRDGGRSAAVSAEVAESLRVALSRVQGQTVDVVDAPRTAAVVSRTGRLFATGDARGRVRLATLWADGSLGPPRVLGPLTGEVVGLAFDGSDRRLFAVDKGGTVRVWDLAAPTPAGRVLDRLASEACAIATDDAGRWLAVSGRYDELRLWDLQASDGRAEQPMRLSFAEGETPICHMAFSPEGDLLAAGDWADQIRLWDLTVPDIGAGRRALALHESDVLDLEFSRDGRWLLSGGGDGAAFLIDRAALAAVPAGATVDAGYFAPGTLRTFAGHEDDVESLAFAPDGTWFATADTGGTARVWQIDGDVVTGPRMIEREHTRLDQLIATPDSRHLVAIASDATIGVWRMPPDTGRIRGYALSGHDSRVRTAVIAGHGDWLFTGSDNGRVLRWELGDGPAGIEPQILRAHSDWVTDVTVAADARHFASASRDGTVKVWPLAPILADRPFEPWTLTEHAGRATAVLFGPGPQAATRSSGAPPCTVFTGDDWGNLRRWQSCAAGRQGGGAQLVAGIGDRVSVLARSPDGRWLVSGDGANRLFAWDMASGSATGRPIQLPHNEGTPNVVRFVDGGDGFLVAGGHGTVEEWALAPAGPRLTRMFQQPGEPGDVRALAYDAASQTVLAGNVRGGVDVWRRTDEAGTGTSLPWAGGRVRSVALAEKGRTAVAVGESPFVQVWPDWGRVDQFQSLPIAVEGAAEVTLSPDERLLAVAGSDGVVYLWARLKTGGYGHRVALTGHGGPVEGVEIVAGPAPGDLHLISFDRAGEIRLWQLDPERLRERACQAAGRNLSPDREWPQYFPGEPWRPTCPDLD